MNTIIKLLPLALIFSCAAVPLTVHEIVQEPTPTQAQKALEARGGVYNLRLGESTLTRRGEILQGNLHVPYDASYDTGAHKQAALKALGTLLSTTKLGKVSTHALARIQTYLPALTYAALAQGVLSAWQDVHTSIASQKCRIKAEDAVLKADRELHAAQLLAVDMIIHLVFLLYCPKAHPCERMYSLYLLNTLNILGSQGLALQRHLARANRFYFENDGTLKSFDPSKGNHLRPKRIKALLKFLRTICVNERQYRKYLYLGIDYGISLLKSHRNQPWNGRESTFAWHYAAGIFKAVSTIDVIRIRTVDPELVFSHKSNSDFLRMMILCSLDGQLEETWHESLQEAQDLLAENQFAPGKAPKFMERYYRESLKRFSPVPLT